MTEIKTRGDKYRETMINKYGSEEAWKAHVKQIASKGGSRERSEPRGFAMDLNRAREAGRKGGKVTKAERNV